MEKPASPHANRPAARRLARMSAIAVIVAAVALIAIKQCSTPAPFAASTPVRSGGDTIDVAVEYGPTLLHTSADGDSLEGFAVDMLRAIAADSMEFKIHPVASGAEALAMLRAGDVDIVAAELASMAGFDSTLRFTEPVRLDRQVLIQLRNAAAPPVESVLDLAGKSVTVPADSHIRARLHNIEAEIGDTIDIVVDSVHGSEQLFLLVATGEIPYAVVNRRVAEALIADYPDVDAAKGISFTQFQAWVTRAADASLAARLDSAIVRIGRSNAEKL